MRIAEQQLRARRTQLPPAERAASPDARAPDHRPRAGAAGAGDGHPRRRRQLDRAIERIAQQNKMTLATSAARARDATACPSPRFREDLRDEIMLARLREREVDSKVQVSERRDRQLSRVPDAEPQASRSSTSIAHILVRVPDRRAPERIEQRAGGRGRACSSCAGGPTSRSSPASYSDAPDALQGGELGWRTADRLPPLFARRAQRHEARARSSAARAQPGRLPPPQARRAARRARPTRRSREQTQRATSCCACSDGHVGGRRRGEASTTCASASSAAADFAELARLHSATTSSGARRRPRLGLPGRHRARVRARDERSCKTGEVSEPVQTPSATT